MPNPKILWADDEMEHLKPQVMFLEGKGYDVTKVTNGHDALEKCKAEDFDVVFLDESMPGITGIETLTRIKEINNSVPIVMITKNEEENLMESAIGQQIADYLIKPVKPHQILLTLKKILDNKRLVTEATNTAYRQGFMQIFSSIQQSSDWHEWVEIYKKIVFWELELDSIKSREMHEILISQKREANSEFVRFVSKNYYQWLRNNEGEAPVMSHNLMKNKVFPAVMADKRPTVLVIIDNLRYDQWRVIQPRISEYFKVEEEEVFYSILPTSTQYSRNAIFAGLMPSEIERRLPKYWINDHEEGGKNLYEEELLQDNIARQRLDIKASYNKITNYQNGRILVENAHNLLNYKMSVIVYNFVDMLSHARTEMEVLKELAGDDAAYRSLTLSWFEHSALFETLKRLADRDIQLLITTDHGTVRVQDPIKVIGDRATTTNLRYKLGKNLNYNPKEVFEIKDPDKYGLPTPNVSSSFIFARSYDYLVYPNNYNQFANYYKDTFQHGGISLEEVIVPFVRLSSK